MANRFWVGGTGTWDSTAGSKWATTSGGTGGETVPGTGDVAVFDANSGAVTVTINSPNGAGVVTVQGLTLTNFTGTLDNSANNNDVTITAALNGGVGAYTLNMGAATWNISSATSTLFALHNSMTLSAASATVNIVSSATGANMNTANKTYGTVTISSTNGGQLNSQGSGATFGTLILGNTAGNFTYVTGANTITSTFTVSGTSSDQIAVINTSGATLTLTGATATATWAAFHRITASGAAITATNSFDLGGNTNVTITPPSVGGGVTGVIGG